MNVLSWISTRWQHATSGYIYKMSVTVTLQDVCLWVSNPWDFCCLKLSETNTLDSDNIYRSVERTSRLLYTSETTPLRGTISEMSDRFTPHTFVMTLSNTKQKKSYFSSILRTLLSALDEKIWPTKYVDVFPLSNSVRTQIFTTKAVKNTVPM